MRRLGSNDQGAGAVADSRARDTRIVTGSDDFYLGGRPGGSAPELVETRRVGVRTFSRAGDRCLDSRCAKGWEAKAKVVLAFSAEYFALVAKEPDLRAAFALGERVVVVAGEQVIEVRPE